MEKGPITQKGQVVIPVKYRRKYKMKGGTSVAFIEQEGGVLVKPLNEDYFTDFMGLLPGKGKALRTLLDERRRDKENEENRPR